MDDKFLILANLKRFYEKIKLLGVPANGGTAARLDGEKVRIFTDEEGGNLEIIAPDGVTMTQMNMYNDKIFRIYVRKADGTLLFPITYDYTDDSIRLNGNILINGTPLPIANNPNLLINPDFKINQRKKTHYPSAKFDYTVDHWSRYWNSIDVEIDRIILNKVISGNHSIYQPIENYKSLQGKTVTFSVDLENISCPDNIGIGFIADYTVIADGTGGHDLMIASEIGSRKVYSKTVTLPETINSNLAFVITIYTGTVESQIALHSAKVELGSIATPFVPPDPATELVKCQRYYCTGHVGGLPQITNNGTLAILPTTVRLPQEMQKVPTIKVFSNFGTEKTISAWGSGTDTSANDIEVADSYRTASGFDVLYSPGGKLAGLSNTTIIFKYTADAEIY